MAEVAIQCSDGSRSRHVVDRTPVTVGRSRESDIFLPDQWLSRHHAEIHLRDGVYFVVDLGSKNGTLINGAPLRQERPLAHGDVITLGEHVLTFLAHEADDEDEDQQEPAGTRVFSARELSDVALQPAAGTAALERQNRLLGILTHSANALLPHRPLQELFQVILDLLFDALPVESGAILLVEGQPPRPVVKASRSRKGEAIGKVSSTIARRVLTQREVLILPNILEDAALKSQHSILSTGVRSALCAPLWFRQSARGPSTQDEVIGLVYLDTLEQSHTFGEEEVQILTALANIAAAKIENVRLLEESIEKRQLEQDLRVAAEIQTSLLPRSAPELPGYSLVGSNQPCRTIGGDYYDFETDARGRLLLALGDVSGKGTGAALLMTVLRAAVRAHWSEERVHEAVSLMNRSVYRNIPSGKFITFFMARLDPSSGRLCYVNAGHNPPLLLRQDGRLETLTEGGIVLGILDSEAYEEGSATIEPGDVLLVFSDGITETWSPDDDEFGENGLADVARPNRHLEAAPLRERILEALERFSEGAKATDDRTLIVLRRDA